MTLPDSRISAIVQRALNTASDEFAVDTCRSGLHELEMLLHHDDGLSPTNYAAILRAMFTLIDQSNLDLLDVCCRLPWRLDMAGAFLAVSSAKDVRIAADAIATSIEHSHTSRDGMLDTILFAMHRWLGPASPEPRSYYNIYVMPVINDICLQRRNQKWAFEFNDDV